MAMALTKLVVNSTIQMAKDKELATASVQNLPEYSKKVVVNYHGYHESTDDKLLSYLGGHFVQKPPSVEEFDIGPMPVRDALVPDNAEHDICVAPEKPASGFIRSRKWLITYK